MPLALQSLLKLGPSRRVDSPPIGAPRRRRARDTVLSGLIAIVAAHFVLAVAVETKKPEWRDPEYGHRIHQLKELHRTQPDRPVVLALGSSRTLMGVSPQDMGLADDPRSPLVYNFGQTGAGPLQVLLTFQRILADGVKPDFILVEIFPAALMNDGAAEDLLKTWDARLNLGDIRRLNPYSYDPAVLERNWFSNRVRSWYTLRFSLMNHWQPNWLPIQQRIDHQWGLMTSHGWMPMPSISPSTRADSIAKARADFEPKLAHFRIGASSNRAFHDLAAACRKQGIRMAFFVTPEGPVFQSWYPPRARLEVAEYLRRLSVELTIPIFDSSDGFGESEFADSHHMLPAGAARFSKRLADEHLKAWLREKRGD